METVNNLLSYGFRVKAPDIKFKFDNISEGGMMTFFRLFQIKRLIYRLEITTISIFLSDCNFSKTFFFF